MSHRVYVDTRAYQLQASRQFIQQAMSQLNAQRSQMSCGHAEVHSSNLSAMNETNTLQNVRFQDKMEAKNTNAMQDKLTATAPDYTVEVLGDWSPALANGLPVDNDFVNINEAGSGDGVRLVEDLECAALDGARMMIFEVDDGHGNTSYKIGLEDSLFDGQGNWLNPDAKKAYDQFLSSALAAQRAALPEDAEQKPTRQRLGAAMRNAGLEDTGSQGTPTGATHVTYSSTSEAATSKPKTRTAGDD